MGAALGIPEWLAGTLFVVGFLLIVGAVAWRNTARQIARTEAKRVSPTRDQFIAMMAPDVSGETACFLWDTAIEYLEPRLAPHPDDDLAKDLPIADEDWSIYWPDEYAEMKGFNASNLADWPDDWPPTLRNFGKWLDMSPKA
ncbi:hypothetical protein K3165_08075 [Qipengyuania sp. 1XM1-15A]|uniref:hypothetical protein n=1 Tax=Qipengyuania xiamenensis TaxID=2867237 RepID=UPI001C86720D|nr:hypothetical protein [Qipengyuania xiamenensis]MBX7532876.1 hypothetical protein [Qipengyuania xiamenensis]